MEAAFILGLAAFIDYLVGDPRSLPHPVQVMGKFIQWQTQWILAATGSSSGRRLGGIIIGVGTIGSSALVGWLLASLASSVHAVIEIGLVAIALASCFAGSSLRRAAEEVLQPLEAGDLETARQQLSQYVGRDTESLSAGEVLRAVLETVAENTTDGVTAPLFYAIIGALLPGVGALPFTFGYKAASTLDSTIGYLTEPYTDVGCFSAKLEDALTWLPCRLSVVTLALMSGQLLKVWQLCRRDAVRDPSPNAGWSECAYAAILQVQMGGKNIYQGQVKHKPFLGDDIEPITPQKVRQALQLTRWCFLLWLVVGSTLCLI